MKFSINKSEPNQVIEQYASELIKEVRNNGHQLVNKEENTNFVLNLVNAKNPRAFKRNNYEQRIVSLMLIDGHKDNLRSFCYSNLVRTLSNLLLCIKPSANGEASQVYCVTPEVGFVKIPFNTQLIYKIMSPVVQSHFAIRNQVVENLPDCSKLEIPAVQELIYYGKKLDKLGLLPAPFPIENVLCQDLIKHIFRLFEMQGISYGNLSVRDSFSGINGNTFWMTARGVEKGKLQAVGKDILLVSGYEEGRGEMVVHVPPIYNPRVRVSVDAIEHYLIYKEFPKVGAILHVHAWIEGIPCTTQNYPCGTRELGEAIVDLLKQSPTPHKTEVGLKNHGLTITGESLKEIFDRINGRLKKSVPMFA